MWKLVDCVGFLCFFSIYTGKKGNGGKPTKGLGQTVVLDLVNELLIHGIGYSIYADNYFSTVSLLFTLSLLHIHYRYDQKKQKVSVLLVIFIYLLTRLLHRTVKDLAFGSIKKTGDFISYVYGPNSLTAWMDSKVVFFCSNHASTEGTHEYHRRGNEHPTPMPGVAKSYRKGMRFVDAHDRALSLYKINRSSPRWWLPIFFHLIDCAIVNAWIIYKINMEKPKLPVRNLKFIIFG